MGEIYSVDKKVITYEGLFRPEEIFDTLRSRGGDKGYFMFERRNFEQVFEHGVQILSEIAASKTISDYLKQVIKIKIEMFRVTEKDVEIDGQRRKYYHGKVNIGMEAQIVTDLSEKWEGAGWLYFLRVINDKFIRKDWISQAKTAVEKDMRELNEEISGLLNMMRFK